MRMDFPKRTAIFLMLDIIPEHIQKTFGLTEDGRLIGRAAGQFVVRGGETIPDNLDGAVIVYHTAQWQMERASVLMDQIEVLQPRCLVMGLAVYQG